MARTRFTRLAGDHLWSGGTTHGSHAWSGGPSVAATLGPGDGLWGDHRWHDRSTLISSKQITCVFNIDCVEISYIRT